MTTPPVRASTILIIDDEPQIRRALIDALAPLATQVLDAETGADGIRLATLHTPELVILDLGLPDMSGVAVCKELRKTSNMPIVVLSARHAELEKVELLLAGADDYVTKPFGHAELVARVQAQLRRAQSAGRPPGNSIVYDGLHIDLAKSEVRRNGERIRLTRIEWQLLHTLVMHHGRTMTHQQIFDAVWAKSFGNAQQYLRVHVTNLRRKIEREPAAPRLIITEPGVGYRFATLE